MSEWSWQRPRGLQKNDTLPQQPIRTWTIGQAHARMHGCAPWPDSGVVGDRDRVRRSMASNATPRDLMRQFTEGGIGRRDFILRAVALGFSASAITAFLAACGGEATA